MEYVLVKTFQLIKRYKALFLMLAVIIITLISYALFYKAGMVGVMALLALVTGLAFILTKNIRPLVFLSLIILVENIFYVFDRSKLVFIYDLKQLVGLFLIGMLVVYLPQIIKSHFLLFKSILIFMGYHILSIFTAYFTMGQPLIKGAYNLLLPSMILIYFFACFLIEKINQYEKFKMLYIYISLVAGIIYILQAQLYPKYVFLTTDFRLRYGNLRFTEFAVFMLFCAFITLNELFIRSGRQLGIKRYVYIAALTVQLYTFFFIALSRYITVTTVVLITITLVFLQKCIPRRLVAALLIWSALGMTTVLIAFYLLGKAPRLDFITDTLQEIFTISGNLGIRSNAVHYFAENLKDHWLLGWGTINLDFPEAYNVSGVRFWHYMVDVGILGYIYQYGILGSFVAFQLLAQSFVISWRIYKKNQRIFFPLLCNGAILINGLMVFFFQENMALFYIGLIFAFTEFEYRIAFHVEEDGNNENTYDFAMSNASSESGQQSSSQKSLSGDSANWS